MRVQKEVAEPVPEIQYPDPGDTGWDLFQAIHDRENIDELLVAHLGAGRSLECRNHEKQTLLLSACFVLNSEAIRALVKEGADVNVRGGDADYCMTPLMMVVRKEPVLNNFVEITAFLLNAGADAVAPLDADGFSTLSLLVCRSEYSKVTVQDRTDPTSAFSKVKALLEAKGATEIYPE